MNIVKGAGETDIIYCISSNASCSLDELAAVRKPGQPLFWQYYVNSNRELASGALQAALDHKMDSIWVTVDAPVGGRREADLRVSLEENPPVAGSKQVKGGSTSEKMFSFVDPDLCWDDLAWIKRQAGEGRSLVIKGVGSVEDAVLAIEAGCDGVVLSNHGGRQLSGCVGNRCSPFILSSLIETAHPWQPPAASLPSVCSRSCAASTATCSTRPRRRSLSTVRLGLATYTLLRLRYVARFAHARLYHLDTLRRHSPRDRRPQSALSGCDGRRSGPDVPVRPVGLRDRRCGQSGRPPPSRGRARHAPARRHPD
jgi:hypothetical protein